MSVSLLKRALVLRGTVDSAEEARRDELVASFPVAPHVTLARIRSAMRRIPRDPGAPARLFDLLRGQLSIEKGALLLREMETGRYSPWIQSGYDYTSRRRLRIPESRVRGIFRASGSQPAVYEPGDWGDMTEFFSLRDSTMRDHLLLAPLPSPVAHRNGDDDEIAAVLVIQRSPFLAASRSVTSLLCSAFAGAAGELLYQGRDGRLAGARQPIVHLASALRETALSYHDQGRTCTLLTVGCNFEAVVRDLPEGTDAPRVIGDLERAVAIELSGIGEVGRAPGTVFCLSTREAHRNLDPVLLEKHLENSFSSLFQTPSSRFSVRLTVIGTRKVGDDDGRRILDSLFETSTA